MEELKSTGVSSVVSTWQQRQDLEELAGRRNHLSCESWGVPHVYTYIYMLSSQYQPFNPGACAVATCKLSLGCFHGSAMRVCTDISINLRTCIRNYMCQNMFENGY